MKLHRLAAMLLIVCGMLILAPITFINLEVVGPAPFTANRIFGVCVMLIGAVSFIKKDPKS